MSEPAKRTPLTDTECAIIAEVSACSPNGWTPLPTHLPAAEKLRQRGTLTRRMDDDGQVNYFLSEAFNAATATAAALEPQIDPAAVN
jgi:hypothetical protein